LVFNTKNATSLLHFYAVVEGEKKLGCKKKIGDRQRSESKLILNTVRTSVKCSLSSIQTLLTDSEMVQECTENGA
jgi:hypothetical protein